MLPLYEMMMKAQNGNAVSEMAKQFGLAQEQAIQAMSALMPAFSSALKRTAANPYDFSQLMTSAASGNYMKYFEDMSKAFTPQGVADGNSMLKAIFGSEEVSKAVAAQAAQVSGIGQDIYRQMMPAMANAMLGGILKQIADQFQAAGEAVAAGRASEFATKWMQATGLMEKPKEPSFENPFLKSFQAFMGAGLQQPMATGMTAASNPFLQMFETMMKASSPAPAPAPKVEPKVEAKVEDPTAFFGQLFETGIEVQKSYQKSLDQIFDGYLASLKSMDKPKG
jgi:hypothetical protein